MTILGAIILAVAMAYCAWAYTILWLVVPQTRRTGEASRRRLRRRLLSKSITDLTPSRSSNWLLTSRIPQGGALTRLGALYGVEPTKKAGHSLPTAHARGAAMGVRLATNRTR